MKVVDTMPVSVSEAKKLLDQRKEDSELEYEQTQAADHAEKFVKHKPEGIMKTAKEMVEKNSNLDMEIAIKLIDIAPRRPETVRAILLRKKVDVTDEEVEEILKMLK